MSLSPEAYPTRSGTLALARLLEIISPSGFEAYFREMALLFPPGGLPDFGEVTKLASEYGLTFNPDWIEDLAAKYHLKLLGR